MRSSVMPNRRRMPWREKTISAEPSVIGAGADSVFSC